MAAVYVFPPSGGPMIKCAGPAPPAARTFKVPKVAVLVYGHPTVATPEIGVGPVNVPLPATVISDDEAAVWVAPVSEPPFVVNKRSLSNDPTLFGLARRSVRVMVSVFPLVVNVADALTGFPPAVAPDGVTKVNVPA